MTRAVSPGRGPRGAALLPVALLLFALTVAAFWGALGGTFLLLDDMLYVKNDVVQSGLTWEGVRLAWTRSFAANWHPVTWLSLMLDVELFGGDPRGFHLVNVLFHAANAVLLLLLLSRVTAAPWSSALAAALFAVHPLRVESVAWVAERKDVLALFFGLLALLAYARYVRRPGVARYLLVTGALALGLASKPTIVVWPLLMLVLDWWPLGRLPGPAADGCAGAGAGRGAMWRGVRGLLREKTPWFLLSAAVSVVTYLAQSRGGAVTFEEQALGFRVTNALWASVAYLRVAIWPNRLAPYYPFVERSPFDLDVLFSLLVLGAVTGLAWAGRRRAPWLAAGWLWYLAALLPVIGLVPIGSHAMADRYTYVSLLGPVAALSWSLAAGAARATAGWRIAVSFVAVGVVLALAGLTRSQTAYWKDDATLFTRLNELVPENPVGYNALGYLNHRAGRLEEAEGLYLEALRSHPKYYQAHLLLAQLYLQTDRPAAAERHYREAVALDDRDPAVQSILGMLLLGRGRAGEALPHLEAVVRLEPELAEAHNNLGVALARSGRAAEAASHFRRAAELDPLLAEARANLGAVTGFAGD